MDGQNQVPQDTPGQFKPGETISPRSQQPAPTPVSASPTAAEPAPPRQTQAAEVVQPANDPQSQSSAPTQSPQPPDPAPPQQSAPSPVADNIAPEQVPASNQEFQPQTNLGDEQFQQQFADQGEAAVSWTASEFVEYSKSSIWHLGLIGVSLVVAAIIWFLTKDVITPIVIIIAGVALSLYGSKRPRQLDYRLTDSGLDIGHRHYNYGDFKSFAVVPEGGIETIVLTPVKRFLPLTTIYFDPDDADNIGEFISRHLPYKERRADPIDKLFNRIRF